MKTLLNKWFMAGCFVWLTVFTSRKLHHPIPYVNGYVTDVFSIPVIASLALCFQRVVVFKNNFYTLSKWQVMFITVYVSLVFELLLPWLSKTYTGDWVDVLLYIVGGIFFYRVMNRPVLEVRDL